MKKFILVVIESYDDLTANVSFYDTFEKAKKELNKSYEYVKSDKKSELLKDIKGKDFYHVIQDDGYDTYEAKAFIEEKEV